MFESNPVISSIAKDRSRGTISYNGVINRTGFLVVLTILTAAFTWLGLNNGTITPTAGMMGNLLGFGVGLAIIFSGTTNPFAISTYALLQGVCLGVLSNLVETRYPGLPLQAVVATFVCFLAMLGGYSTGLLRATPMFKKFIVVALLGILGLYLADLIAQLFGGGFEIIHGTSWTSIGLSAVIVTIATLSFICDFDEIENAVRSGVSEDLAWRFAFGLLVGLIWLYVEILRLLIKLRSRD